MTDFHALIDSYRGCACGQEHECAVRDIAIITMFLTTGIRIS